MHTLGFILVLFATLQQPAPPAETNDGTIPFFRYAIPSDDAVIIVPQLPQIPRSHPFRAPDRHEDANEKRTFVCPKDGSVLIVDAAYADKTFKCPVDATEMKAGVGRAEKKYFLLEEK